MQRKFGIEFEYQPEGYNHSAAQHIGETMAQFLNSRPLRLRGTRRGSFYAHTEHAGLVEMKTPILTPRDWPLVFSAVSNITRNGGRFSRSAGTHMHLDRSYIPIAQRSYQSAKWALVWGSVESYVEQLVMEYRRNNQWCTRSRFFTNFRRTKAAILASDPANPPASISYGGGSSCRFYTGHQTTEVRLHHCTLDYLECRSWISLMNVLLDVSDNATHEEVNRLRRYRPRRARILVHRWIERYSTPAKKQWLFSQLHRRETQYSSPAQLLR